jgi:hypothetical protein
MTIRLGQDIRVLVGINTVDVKQCELAANGIAFCTAIDFFLSLQCSYGNTSLSYQYVGFACFHGLCILMSHLEDVAVGRRIILKSILRMNR